MDIGDVFWLILLGIGFLSSLAGKKKKGGGAAQRPSGTRPAQRPPPSRRTPAPTGRVGGGGDRKVGGHMEDILRQLQLRVEEAAGLPKGTVQFVGRGEEEESEAPGAVSTPPRASTPAPRRRTDTPVPPPPEDTAWNKGLERHARQAETHALDEADHEAFHDQYISPVTLTTAPGLQGTGPRVRRLLNRNSLRDAVLAQEILGPPKALR